MRQKKPSTLGDEEIYTGRDMEVFIRFPAADIIRGGGGVERETGRRGEEKRQREEKRKRMREGEMMSFITNYVPGRKIPQ